MLKPEIRRYSEIAQTFITNDSKRHNGNGEICYPYAFGYSLSEMAWTLEKLSLNKRQIKILKELTTKLEADIIDIT
jgi:hypothetical protein